jgi:hypothetical protein
MKAGSSLRTQVRHPMKHHPSFHGSTQLNIPIIVYQPGDPMIFGSAAAVAQYLEPIDMEGPSGNLADSFPL